MTRRVSGSHGCGIPTWMDGDYTSWIAAIAATVLMLTLGGSKRMLEPKRRRMRCAVCGRQILRRRCPCLDE